MEPYLPDLKLLTKVRDKDAPSHQLCLIYIYISGRGCKQMAKPIVTHFKLRKWTLNTLMFADDQVMFAKSEMIYNFQSATL
jgi:hypothetical protein